MVEGLPPMNIALESLVILLLVLVNALFAGSEIAVVASRKARLQRRTAEGDARASRALELANDPNRFLSTVQIGITLAGVTAGAFGGMTIAVELAGWLATMPPLERYAQPLAVIAVVASITYLTLVIGELVPKRLALAHPEAIAARMAGTMHRLSRLATPLVRLLSVSTNAVLRLLPFREPEEPAVTTDDVRVLLEQGARAGVFLATEQDIVENVFWLGDQRVSSVMTPRHRIVWLDVNAAPQQQAAVMRDSPQNRYILCEGGLDAVVGVVSMKDLWVDALEGREPDVQAHSATPLFVPATTRALTVLEQFRKTTVHVAVVVDEYGSAQGMVTLTDILEGLVGELAELAEDAVVQRTDGSWLVNAAVEMEAVLDLLGLPGLAGDDAECRTLGGFIMHRLGHVPRAAEHFDWEGYRVEVVDMDGRRIDQVLISRTTPQ
jgi:putative hemolysin